MNSLKTKGIIFFVMLMAITAFTWAFTHRAWYKPETKPMTKASSTETTEKAPVYDKTVLQKFEAVCQTFNMEKPVFTCSGIINVNDGADSSKNIKNLDFVMSKNKADCFYQFGHTVMLNAGGMYICIENDQKRVIVGAQKKIIGAPMPDISKMIGVLSADHYSLTDTITGKSETIAFRNENHITCKAYAITFDTASKKVSRVYTRLSNINAPERTDKDKIIDIIINACTDTADPDKYLGRYNVVRQTGNGIKLTEKYKGYEMINL